MARVQTISKVDTETGEIYQVPAVQYGYLYGLYGVVSNKSVRQREKLMIRWWNKGKKVPGDEMIKTNRGWFLDGWNVDEKSVESWFQATGNDRSFRPNFKKKWNSKKRLQK